MDHTQYFLLPYVCWFFHIYGGICRRTAGNQQAEYLGDCDDLPPCRIRSRELPDQEMDQRRENVNPGLTGAKENGTMLKILRITLALIVIIMAGYGFFTDNVWLLPYTLFIMSIMLLVMGLEEFQKGRTEYGYISVAACIFLMIVLFTI
jgi:Protein of unknown function (DUF3953)